MRTLVLYIVCLTCRYCLGQVGLSTTFYYPEIDSLLWESPISPRMVLKERIKKAEVLQKIWRCECKNCPDWNRDPRRVKCVYTKNTRIYTYDSLGFPLRIVLQADSESMESHEFKCNNAYDTLGHLLKSELLLIDKKNDSLILKSTNTRQYNEENLLEISEVYFSTSTILSKRTYKYDSSGNLKQFFRSRFVGDRSEMTGSPTFLYDIKNRLIQSGDVSYQQIFLYDITCKDSGFYVLNHNRITNKALRIDLEAGTTGTVFVTSWQHPVKRLLCKKSELTDIKEIRDDKIYYRHYNYTEKGIATNCYVIEHGTGLPIYRVTNYGGPNRRRKPSIKYVRFIRVKTPGKQFRIELPNQPNIIEYSFTKW